MCSQMLLMTFPSQMLRKLLSQVNLLFLQMRSPYLRLHPSGAHHTADSALPGTRARAAGTAEATAGPPPPAVHLWPPHWLSLLTARAMLCMSLRLLRHITCPRARVPSFLMIFSPVEVDMSPASLNMAALSPPPLFPLGVCLYASRGSKDLTPFISFLLRRVRPSRTS